MSLMNGNGGLSAAEFLGHSSVEVTRNHYAFCTNWWKLGKCKWQQRKH